MTAFSDALTLAVEGDGVFGWDVPDGWQQGRGAWGGLVTGGAAQAVRIHEDNPDRTLRTLSIHMFGPLPPGRATVRVQPLRLGSGMSTWSLSIDSATGGPCAHAVAVTGTTRAPDLAGATATWGTVAPPRLPTWDELARQPMDAESWPPFMKHLDFRIVEGLPQSGQARCAGYIRFTDQGPWDAISLLSIVDAWYPTAFGALEDLRPMATVTYAAHLLLDPASVPSGEPLAFDSFMSAAHEGFTTETRRLWTADGRLAVENHQSIVVIR